MKIGLGRYQVRISVRNRVEQVTAAQTGEREPSGRDLSRLAQAEREYHDTIWKPQSLLDGTR